MDVQKAIYQLMDVQKAIYQLKILIEGKEDFIHGDDDASEVFLEDIEACKMGISALEKQVPKEVKREFITENGCITCFETDVCPSCGMDFYIDDLGQTMYCDFCPNCGQALDWSDENE